MFGKQVQKLGILEKYRLIDPHSLNIGWSKYIFYGTKVNPHVLFQTLFLRGQRAASVHSDDIAILQNLNHNGVLWFV